MAFILKPVEKDCVCLVSGKRHIAHERTEMSVLVSESGILLTRALIRGLS